MADIEINNIKAIFNDLQTIGNQVAKDMAIKYRDMLCEEYENAVDDIFYNAYTPKYYKRIYSLGGSNSGGSRSYAPFYKNPHGNIIRGGIEFTSERMKKHSHINKKGEEITTDNDYILSLALSGYHGNKNIYTTPTLYNHMIAYRDLLVADAQHICDSVYKG